MIANLGNFVLLLVGFGFVIFIHELGHFVVAKWVGIKVEQFAIGFGPAVGAWRKGIGFRRGSTNPEFARRIKAGEPESSLGETEYRINWLPLGGYVKMLGQEDMDPSAKSDDPRSYNSKPVWARMCVVSAGVVMNVILAVFLFVGCYLWGVEVEPPIIGSVAPFGEAYYAVPTNAEEQGITERGLKPGDRVVRIDGQEITAFNKIRMRVAMSRADRPLTLEVLRGETLLTFKIQPKPDQQMKLLALGVYPSYSRTIAPMSAEILRMALDPVIATDPPGEGAQPQVELAPGMILTEVDGRPIENLWELDQLLDDGGFDGRAIDLGFAPGGDDQAARRLIHLSVTPQPNLMIGFRADGYNYSSTHLLGLFPVIRVGTFSKRSAADKAGVREGDLIARIGAIAWPRFDQLRAEAQASARQTIEMEVIGDDGERKRFSIEVGRDGMLGLTTAIVFDDTRLAAPADGDATIRFSTVDEEAALPTRQPLAATVLNILPGTRIISVAGRPVADWREIRHALRSGTDPDNSDEWTVAITLQLPTQGLPIETLEWSIPGDQVRQLHNLGWNIDPVPNLFAYAQERQVAAGPIDAIRHGFRETTDMLVMTYLTLDRLFRGTIKAEHLKGPVGIVELGTKVASRGLVSLILFLAIISVNLAVLNFLPIPIVDGGLFLFLVIEKIKGSPVSDRIQNLATIAGLFLIGTVFLVTFYNDVSSLISNFIS